MNEIKRKAIAADAAIGALLAEARTYPEEERTLESAQRVIRDIAARQPK